MKLSMTVEPQMPGYHQISTPVQVMKCHDLVCPCYDAERRHMLSAICIGHTHPRSCLVQFADRHVCCKRQTGTNKNGSWLEMPLLLLMQRNLRLSREGPPICVLQSYG